MSSGSGLALPDHLWLEPANLILIMGVSGCGKSTLGVALADALNCPFIEADDYHSPDARKQMRSGIPLEDADRWPWLEKVAKAAAKAAHKNGKAVIACSALKQTYREYLAQVANQNLAIVYLQSDPQTILKRIKQRRGHFMSAELVQSQFAALEPPKSGENAITLSADTPVASAVHHLKSVCLGE